MRFPVLRCKESKVRKLVLIRESSQEVRWIELLVDLLGDNGWEDLENEISSPSDSNSTSGWNGGEI